MKDQLTEKINFYVKKTSIISEELNNVKTYNEVLENLIEGVTRKHFQQTAEAIAANPDENERTKLINHHAQLFSRQNPRFDVNRFKDAVSKHVKHLSTINQ